MSLQLTFLLFIGLVYRVSIINSSNITCSSLLLLQPNNYTESHSSNPIVKIDSNKYLNDGAIQITISSLLRNEKIRSVALRAKTSYSSNIGRWEAKMLKISNQTCEGVLIGSIFQRSLTVQWTPDSIPHNPIDIEILVVMNDGTVIKNYSRINLPSSKQIHTKQLSKLSVTSDETPVLDTTPTASNASVVGLNVSWTFEMGSLTRIRMIAYNLQISQWVALGFSSDGMMGKSHVFICRRLANSSVAVDRYINPGGHQDPEPAGDEDGGTFKVEKESFDNGVTSCHFSLSNFQNEKIEHFRDVPKLSQSASYYPIIAIGQLDSDDEILEHADDSHFSENYQVQLNVAQVIPFRLPPSTVKRDFLKIHGILMIIAWILIASTGSIIARYFKNVWQNNKLCGKDVWFSLHRFLMSLTAILTLLGFMFIFTYKKASWVDDDDSFKHAIMGAVVTVLAFIQPFVAHFRCDPNSPNRFIFNYVHAFLGIGAFSLSIATIFTATYYFTGIFPDTTSRSLMIIWAIWIFLVVMAFEIVQRKFISKEANDDVTTNSFTSSNEVKGSAFASHTFQQRVKVILLVLHLSISLGVSIALFVPIIKIK